jgi:hypothetical protein
MPCFFNTKDTKSHKGHEEVANVFTWLIHRRDRQAA